MISELTLLVSKSKPAVISVTETWLDKSVLNGEINIDEYSILGNDRLQLAVESVCIIIQNKNAFFKLLDQNKPEAIILHNYIYFT